MKINLEDVQAPIMSSADFAHWEKRYAASDYLYGTEPNAFLKAQANLLPKAGKALAVADGEGRNGVWLAEQGLDVLSVDFSPKAQAKAKALAERRGVAVRFVQADVTAWDWPTAEFDVIAVIFIQFAGRRGAGASSPAFARPSSRADFCCCRATVRSRSPTTPAGRRRSRTSTPKRCCARNSAASASSTSGCMTAW